MWRIVGIWPWSPSPRCVFPHFHIFSFHLIPIMSACFLGDLTLLKKGRDILQIRPPSKGEPLAIFCFDFLFSESQRLRGGVACCSLSPPSVYGTTSESASCLLARGRFHWGIPPWGDPALPFSSRSLRKMSSWGILSLLSCLLGGSSPVGSRPSEQSRLPCAALWGGCLAGGSRPSQMRCFAGGSLPV